MYRVELTGLVPGGTVYLVAGEPTSGISREFKVRTIPHDRRPLRFVAGGDMGPGFETRALLRQAARTEPDFALIGGDIAYANGLVEQVARWDSWLAYYTEEMVTADGCSVPVILAIGNHEVNAKDGPPEERAPFFFGLFGQGGRSYFHRRLGANLSLFVLDSGHVAEHGGAQGAWLEEALRSAAHVRHKVELYHVPLYPSHRAFDGSESRLGREHWAPLFDRHGLSVAFENHDHAFKRSAPLRGNEVASGGVVYLGDGCFGRQPRAVTYGGRWFLEKAGSIAHFWSVEVREGGMACRAIDMGGRVFDVYPETEPGAAEAASVWATMPIRYRLPDGAITVTPLPLAGTTWRSGTTTVTVRNPFEDPIEVAVVLSKGPKDGVAEPGSAVRIAPGETGRVPVSLRVPAPIAHEAVEFALRVEAVLLPEDGERIGLTNQFAVPRGLE